MRAFAAILVYFHHFNPSLTFGSLKPLESLFDETHVGVSVFFVLSGFLIAYRNKDEVFSSSSGFKKYFTNRVARVYPVYFILTILSFIVYIFAKHGSFYPNMFDAEKLKVLFFNLSLLKGFSLQYKFTLIGQGWSLTVEELFYLSFPVLIILTRKKSLMLLLSSIFLLFIGIILYYGLAFFCDDSIKDNLFFMLTYTFFGRSFEFITGVFIALNFDFLTQKFIPISRNFILTIFGFIGILGCIWLLASFQIKGLHGIQTFQGKMVNNFLLPIFIGFFILGLVKEDTLVSSIFSSDLFKLLGKSSYSFYLIHLGIFQQAIHHFISKSYIFQFVSLWFLAYLLYFFVEEPLNRWIRKLG